MKGYFIPQKSRRKDFKFFTAGSWYVWKDKYVELKQCEMYLYIKIG